MCREQWGSQRVAEKAGFVLAREYTMYANQPVAEHATDLSLAAWQEHAAFFDRPLRFFTRRSGVLGMRAAAAWAMVGEHAQALALLHRLVDIGYITPTRRAWFEQHWEFESLHTYPGWPEFLTRLGPAPP